MEISVGSLSFILDLSLTDVGMLAFLIGLTVISFYYMRRARKNRVTKLGNFETLKEIHGSGSTGSPVILGAKILVVSILFLTATESIQVEATQPVTDTEYVIAIDSSQSMLIPDYDPNRLGYVKDRISAWINDMPVRAEVSVVEYSSEAEIRALPTKNTGRLVDAIKEVEVELNKSGTAVSDAMNTSIEVLEDGGKVLILTDGNNLRNEEIQSAMEIARNSSSEFYFFDVPRNNNTEQLYQQLNLSLAEANLEGSVGEEDMSSALRTLADISGGSYYRVDNSEFFQAALDDTSTKERKIGVDSSFYILLFISFFMIFEMVLYSRYGAL